MVKYMTGQDGGSHGDDYALIRTHQPMTTMIINDKLKQLNLN